MAGAPWKPLFWERYNDSFSVAAVVRRRLATVTLDLASPLRSGEEDGALVCIAEAEKKLAGSSRLLAFMLSALGTLELLALRCMLTGDSEEGRARARALEARQRASEAYEAVASSRGHLGAAGRLAAASGILDDAVNDERQAVLAAVQAAGEVLDAIQGLRSRDASIGLPRADSRARSPTAATYLVGASSDAAAAAAAWSSLAASVPGDLLRVALSGAIPEITAAQAALQLEADAILKLSKVSSSSAAAADWSPSYIASFHALNAAHDELSRLLALKKESAVLFARCAPQLRLDSGGMEWRSLEESRADAERHGRAALDLLWSASAIADYVFSGELAWGSTSSAGQEARDLMGRALADAGQARDTGDLLRHAAGREFFYASMLLHGAPSA